MQNTTSSAAREPRRARRARSHHEGIVHDLVRHIVLLPLDVAILQTYTLPSFDLTYHAPGFITVRNFQSRLHPSILLSHPHSPYKPSIKKRSSPSYRRTCTLSNRRNAMNRIRMSSQEALSSLSPLFHETSFTAHTSCPSSVWHGTQEADPVPFPSDCTRHGAEFR